MPSQSSPSLYLRDERLDNMYVPMLGECCMYASHDGPLPIALIVHYY
jgi:hypothetical protein